jgi:hypothetical protein
METGDRFAIRARANQRGNKAQWASRQKQLRMQESLCDSRARHLLWRQYNECGCYLIGITFFKMIDDSAIMLSV